MNASSASAPAPATPESNPEVARRFRYWQTRTLVSLMFGYAAFYFVRKNLSFAMPAMQEDLHITKADLGLFLTLHGLLYGVSRFVNGMWADRANARYFMVAGLMLSVVANVFFGFSSSVLFLGVAWMVNGWVQGMGFPPCCRLMTHWFPPERLATKMSIWNTSHSIGAWVAAVFCGYIVAFGWRWCFFAPAILCTLAGIILFLLLRDTPTSVGLPEIQVTGTQHAHNEDKSTEEYKTFVRRHVFGNPYIWWISLANFFVYILRFAVLDWGPTLLKEMKGFSLHHAGWMVAGFEVSGLIGMLLAGWATDKFFGGRGARMCVLCMIGAATSLFAFWKIPGDSPVMSMVFLGAAGFFIYGPQALIGIIAANLATKRAAATAAGFTGLFGYASTLISGWGLGKLVQTSGWDIAFGALLGVGAIGTFMFILAWPAKAHGYDE
ncbi:MFS transporter [Opitutus sp. ER46]|uniref:MFS transporter n=1 Tax=Opitutus sp. ER46 TaxID=2161864 RepID=UPI000D2FB198|nr:MFS transporter [Opitutus sp. ER46]PTX91553.1 MFS transporter [Opitutus sp. ER46]